MKNKTMLAAAAAMLFTLSASGHAKSITVTAETLESAEAQIAEKAAQLNVRYKIIEASTSNRIHMTAKLY